jgi:hypothetical protein
MPDLDSFGSQFRLHKHYRAPNVIRSIVNSAVDGHGDGFNWGGSEAAAHFFSPILTKRGWTLGGNSDHTSLSSSSTYFAPRPTSQETHPTAAKNIIAIQAFESESLPVMIAVKMVRAAIQHTRAIARLHQQRTDPKRPDMLVWPPARVQTSATNQPRSRLPTTKRFEKPTVLIRLDIDPIRAKVRSLQAGTRCPRSVAPSQTSCHLASPHRFS